MPTRKISDDQDTRPRRHPNHDPPNMRVFEPGLYEHECPGRRYMRSFSSTMMPRLIRQAPWVLTLHLTANC